MLKWNVLWSLWALLTITTDLWTSRAKHAYTGLAVYYISEEFILQSLLLATKEFHNSRTVENILEELEAILGAWKLSVDRLCAATTDNVGNVLATQIWGWPRMPCFSHTLQLAVEQALSLPEVSKALAGSWHLVSHFNYSSKSAYLLKQKQKDLHHPKHSLI